MKKLIIFAAIILFSSCSVYESRIRADMAQDILRNPEIRVNEAGLIYLDSVTCKCLLEQLKTK